MSDLSLLSDNSRSQVLIFSFVQIGQQHHDPKVYDDNLANMKIEQNRRRLQACVGSGDILAMDKYHSTKPYDPHQH